MFHSAFIKKYAKPLVVCVIVIWCQSASATWWGKKAKPGKLTDFSFVGFQSKKEINKGIEERGLSSVIEPASCGVLSVKINYLSTGVEPNEDSPLEELSGTIHIPWGFNRICRSNLPLLGSAHGTRTKEGYSTTDLDDIFFELAVFPAQGYVQVSPDYYGLGDSTLDFHPYVHADSGAQSMINAIRAAKRFTHILGFKRKMSGKVMLRGYSQGGHVAMATQRAIEANYLNEINLVATAPLSGPYTPEKMAREQLDPARPNVAAGTYFSYVLKGYQAIFGDLYDDPSEVLQTPYDQLLVDNYPGLDVNTLILGGFYPVDPNEFLQPGFVNDFLVNDSNRVFVAAQKQSLLDFTPKTPMVLCGSSEDGAVPFFQAELAAQFFSEQGVSVPVIDVASLVQVPSGLEAGLAHHLVARPICNAVVKQQLFDLSR